MSDETRTATCENCEQEKVIPIVRVADEFDIEGLCGDCVATYGMQLGDPVRLTRPAANGETDVLFIGTAVNAIRVRLSDGLTELVAWGDFKRRD